MPFWVCLILNLFNFVQASWNFVLGLNRELKNEEPKAQKKNQDFGRISEEFRKKRIVKKYSRKEWWYKLKIKTFFQKNCPKKLAKSRKNKIFRFSCIPCCLIPLMCMDSMKNTKHTCPKKGCSLGTYNPWFFYLETPPVFVIKWNFFADFLTLCCCFRMRKIKKKRM